jgi:repressor LexA
MGYKTKSAINKIEMGINDVSQSKIVKFAEVLGVSIAYLMDWEDDEKSTPHPSIPTAKNIIPMPEMRKIPLLGTIACGEPILAVENIAEYVDIPKNIPADFALTCKGDSMINARIFNGDIVYIRQQESVENGEIAAILIGDEATLKRVRLFDDHIILEPENPMYRPLVYWGEDMNKVRIIGKAIAFTSPLV